MFRPNRIGTPWMHQSPGSSNADFTLNQNAYNADTLPFNLVNASPHTDFGFDLLKFAGTEAVSADNKFTIGQQFTITAPLAGDTVGVEISGTLQIRCPSSALLLPAFARLSAAGASVLAGVNSYDYARFLGDGDKEVPTEDGQHPRVLSYKEQVIVRNTDPAILAGTYGHGVTVIDGSGAGWNLVQFYASFSIRQLNDQQLVGYRDTLR